MGWGRKAARFAQGGFFAFVLLPAAAFAEPEYSVVFRLTDQNVSGAYPTDGVLVGQDGALYGATPYGGVPNHGTLFKLVPPATGSYASGWTKGWLRPFPKKNEDIGYNQGGLPLGGLSFNDAGKLVGTAFNSGWLDGKIHDDSGSVFEADPATGNPVAIHKFESEPAPRGPSGGLLQVDGRYYGVSQMGGIGHGTIFELASGIVTVVHTFKGWPSPDGAGPWAGLTLGPDNWIYGTTRFGGRFGFGTVFRFKRKPNGSFVYKRIYSFTADTGGRPEGRLVVKADGTLIGTNVGSSSTFGAVFKLKAFANPDREWKFTLLHLFGQAAADGTYPYSGLVMDSGGVLYGTTLYGGRNTANCVKPDQEANGCGTIYRLTPQGDSYAYKVVYRFTGVAAGRNPLGGLAIGTDQALYGTTSKGGNSNCGRTEGCGVVFRFAP